MNIFNECQTTKEDTSRCQPSSAAAKGISQTGNVINPFKGKSQNKTLEPGVGTSFYGKPPFKVLTLGLNQVDLYFQGAKVRVGTASKTIILEAAEVSQPTASTNSQLR